MNETIILGGLFSIVQAGLWLWVRNALSNHRDLTKSIIALTSSVSEFKLVTAKEYVSKADLKDFIERNDKVQSELKAYLMAMHDKH